MFGESGYRICTKLFRELSEDELISILKFRNKVCIEADYITDVQSISEIKESGIKTYHLMVMDYEEKLIGYARVRSANGNNGNVMEVSRFFVNREHRGRLTGSEPIFALYAGLLQFSQENDISDWSALIDMRFFFLCKRSMNIMIEQASENFYYLGSYCVPSVISVEETINANKGNPMYKEIFSYLKNERPVFKELCVH